MIFIFAFCFRLNRKKPKEPGTWSIGSEVRILGLSNQATTSRGRGGSAPRNPLECDLLRAGSGRRFEEGVAAATRITRHRSETERETMVESDVDLWTTRVLSSQGFSLQHQERRRPVANSAHRPPFPLGNKSARHLCIARNERLHAIRVHEVPWTLCYDRCLGRR